MHEIVQIFHVREITDPDDGYAGKILPPEDVFNVRRPQPQHLLNFIAHHAEGRTVVGLKIFRDHLRPINWHKVIGWCDVCVVLRREDTRAQYRSLLRARRTGKWKSWKAKTARSVDGSEPIGGESSIRNTSDVMYGDERSGNARMSAPNSNVGTRYGLGVGGSGLDGYREWQGNQAFWYAAVTRKIAERGSNATLVTLSFEKDLARGVGPDISRVWSALRLSPPMANAAAHRSRRAHSHDSSIHNF